jgi:SAM-dependent methyltransferase
MKTDTEIRTPARAGASDPRPCPACGCLRPRSCGTIASQGCDFGFADGGHLQQCPVCQLLFLVKPGDAPDLTHQYEELPSDLLAEIPRRRDFDLALGEIEQCPGVSRVLDVGCFRGDFLVQLPPRIAKYGIEPSRAARAVAEKRGIALVGESIDAAQLKETGFDVITMIDVLEHLANPLEGLRRVSRWLRPGGRLIVGTGNSDALPWRLSRLRYWYYFPQHITFVGGRWFEWAATQMPVRLLRTLPYSHSRRAYGKWFVAERWREFTKIVLRWSCQRLTARPILAQAAGSATWPDHMLAVFEARPEAAGVRHHG